MEKTSRLHKYLDIKDRKKILLMCDDIRAHSGVGTMAREIVVNTAHHFNWVNLGGLVQHQEEGKIVDLSLEVAKHAGIEDASVKIYPSSGYGDPFKVRSLLEREKPDAIFLFTDPRYWVWVFNMEREIRQKIPIFYLNIWDEYPAPMYNEGFYESVDLLMAISKQTKNINELVLGDKAKDKVITYVPHGINENHFFKIKPEHENYTTFLDFKRNLFKGKVPEFILFYNSRNLSRKSTSDILLAYARFCDKIGKENARKCSLILHTDPVDQHGTDLFAVKEALCDPDYVNVLFSTEKLEVEQLNLLYNIADATILVSSNEGWGLSLTESMMTETMIITNVTGGMQDQCRFEDSEGKWIDFSPNFPSNHRGTFKKCGEWVIPVFPSNISLKGSVQTPYIFDDRADIEDISEAIKTVYEMDPEERNQRGTAGKTWATSEEAGLTAKRMGVRVIESCNEAFDNFTPREKYDITKIEPKKLKQIKHRLFDYEY